MNLIKNLTSPTPEKEKKQRNLIIKVASVIVALHVAIATNVIDLTAFGLSEAMIGAIMNGFVTLEVVAGALGLKKQSATVGTTTGKTEG